MAKKFGPGRCVYCLEEFDELTSDHIIPESWYPSSKPKDVELPQAPACRGCNSEFGELERKLREQLGFAIDPGFEGGEGIGDKSLRSIDPREGKSEKDRAIRVRNRDIIADNIQYIRYLDGLRVLPNIGTVSPDDGGVYQATAVPITPLNRAIRKWVRGFAWYCEGRHLGKDYVVQAKTIGEDPGKVNAGWWAPEVRIGPGVIIKRKISPDDPVIGLYVFHLWSRLELLGAVLRTDWVLRTGAEIVKMQLRCR